GRGGRGCHGLRHPPLPRGGRVLRLGGLHRRRADHRQRGARGARPALLRRLPHRGHAAGRSARRRGGGARPARRRGGGDPGRPRDPRSGARSPGARRTRPPGRCGRASGHPAAPDERRLPAPARRLGGSRMSWRRLRTLIRREVRATLRDPFTATILIVVPLGALLVFGFVLSTSVKHLSLAVLDANATTDLSRRPVPGQAGVDVVTRALFNPTLDGTRFMVSGTFGFVLSFLTTLITAVSIVNERLAGTFEQLQVTPATSLEIFLGKILPLGAVFALDVLLMALVAGFALGVWPQGNILFFLVVSTFYVLVSLALGLLFSATSS